MKPAKKTGGCVKNPGPGPGAYVLPTTLGYRQHDFTRERLPAFSMGLRPVADFQSIGPGPSVYVQNYNRYGQITSPAFSMAKLLAPPSSFSVPGPGTYSPETWVEKGPSISLKSRLPLSTRYQTPAPNEYTLPPALRGHVDHLGIRLDTTVKPRSPGPAQYSVAELDKYRWKMPHYSMGQRTPVLQDRSQKPGPAEYLPEYNAKRSAPQYSFGTKHSECETLPFTDEDKYPPGCRDD